MPAINPGFNANVAAYQNTASNSGASTQGQIREQARMNDPKPDNAAYGPSRQAQQSADTATFSPQALDALASAQSVQGSGAVNATARAQASDLRSSTSSGQASAETSAMIRQYQTNQAAAEESASGLAATEPARASQSRINELTGVSGADQPVAS